MATVADEIRGLAIANIMAALRDDATIVELGSTLAEMRHRSNRSAITNATYVIDWLDADTNCPTCPYLDSLEDEEEFCECGAEEEDAAVEHLSNWVTDLLNDAYVPSLGTRIVFCTN